MDREFPDPSSLRSAPLLVPPGAGDQFDFGAYATHWKINGSQTGGRFAVVHHPLMPHALAAPLHRHHREDEYSYVLPAPSVHCSVTPSLQPSQAHGYSNHAASGIRSGTRAMRHVKSLRSYRLLDLKIIGGNCAQSGLTEQNLRLFCKSTNWM